MFGSRSIIAASKFGAVLFDGDAFSSRLPAVTLHGYIRAAEEVANALKEADPRHNRSSADNA